MTTDRETGSSKRGTTTPTRGQRLLDAKRNLKTAKQELKYYAELVAQYDKEVEGLKNENADAVVLHQRGDDNGDAV